MNYIILLNIRLMIFYFQWENSLKKQVISNKNINKDSMNKISYFYNLFSFLYLFKLCILELSLLDSYFLFGKQL